ncbi:MAG: ABC-type polysaccharide/polyol phosphate transport system, ATPase component [Rhodocyclaceae bacterium]|nr:ABC-type polysaccharide/polyol phosphate transport system, ATPase component [Rhodocyclaceae bacterium]
MSNAILVRNLSKRYLLRHAARPAYPTLRDAIGSGLRRALRGGRQEPGGAVTEEEFWALKDISFEIMQGDRIGIVGRNGAGKSTLLKILSRITEPSAGRIELNGRVVSLLEVGTGFHPELTGRENIFLNGSIMGMSRQEIARKFDEIVAFAEVEKFLDTPVKRYSSGMYVRLAFSVAAHLEPEILIVDEVLAVGDAAFQRKCLGKMEDVSVQEGRTVLFVSHNMGTIRQLCNAAMMLDRGALVASGPVSDIVTRYLRTVTGPVETSPDDVPEGQVRFLAWRLEGSTADDPHSCYSRENCRFVFRLVARTRVPHVRMGFIIQTLTGIRVVSGTSNTTHSEGLTLMPGCWDVIFTLNVPLKVDTYRVSVNIKSGNEYVTAWSAEPELVVLPAGDQLLSDAGSGLLNEPVKFCISPSCP